MLVIHQDVAALFNWNDEVFVPGRLVRHSLSTDSTTIVFYNMHNYELDEQGSRRGRLALERDVALASANPFSYFVIVLGDFNRPKLGEFRKYIDPIAQANYMQNFS
eukprot:12429017-Karenia_brevis.AAC.2